MSVLMGVGVGAIVYGLTQNTFLAVTAGCLGLLIWFFGRHG